jgi:hypothetical protein
MSFNKVGFSAQTRELARRMYGATCCVHGCMEPATELHHALPNTVVNNKKYPLFTQSLLNCRPVCRTCHEAYTKHPELRVTEHQARIWEIWLAATKEEMCTNT